MMDLTDMDASAMQLKDHFKPAHQSSYVTWGPAPHLDVSSKPFIYLFLWRKFIALAGAVRPPLKVIHTLGCGHKLRGSL